MSATPDTTASVSPGGSHGRTARNVLVIASGELLGKTATLVFTIVVARELSLSDFGSLSYAFAVGLLLQTLVGWGFDADVVRRGAANRADLDVALGQALVLRSLHALPVLLLGAVTAAVTRPDAAAGQALLLILLATVLDSYGDAGRSAATALEQPGRTIIALVLQRVAACLLAVGALFAGGDLVAVSGAYLLSSVLGQLALVAVLRTLGVRPRLRGLVPAELRAMWRRVLPIGVDSVLSMALFRIDAIMLAALANDVELAAYAVAYRLLETVLFVNWAVTRSVFPAMVRAKGGAALLRVGQVAVAVVAAVLVPYGVLVLLEGGELVRLLFGDGYAGTSQVALQFLAFAPVAFAVSFLASYLLLVQQRNARMMVATAIGVLVNVVMNLVLIPWYGASGAAAATTLSYLCQAAVALAFLAPGNGLLRVDRALSIPVLAALPMAASLLLLESPVLAEAAGGAGVYAAAYLLLARWRDPQQLEVLRSMVTRR